MSRRPWTARATALGAALCGLLLIVGASVAQPPKTARTETLKAAPAKRGAAKSPEIKDHNKKGNPATRNKKPASKGGTATRSALPVFHVDNRVNEFVDVYLDGYYEGTIPPYGDMYRYVDTGSHRFYGEGDEGTTFGPKTVTVGRGGYTLTLTD